MVKAAICGWSARGSNRHITKTLSATGSNKERPRFANRRSIVLAMKMTIVLLTFGFLNVYAKGVSQTVTFRGENVPLEVVFSSIEKQTGFLFFYKASALLTSKRVTVKAENIPLDQFLSRILTPQSLEYTINGKSIFITPKSGESQSGTAGEIISLFQDTLIVIRGKVINEKGEPLIGATVAVRGRSVSTVTNEQGNFTLRIMPGSILVISYVGFDVREIRYSSSNNPVITLKPAIARLEEIQITVNTGYQDFNRERSAGSFAKPDMKYFVNASAGTNLIARLDGLVSGLTVNRSPNSPGVLIRGLTSINSSQAPLYVVDGLPTSDISTINFNDVADVTVLKDATAASIWGARAANGVISIVTKRGSRDGNLKIDYDVTYTFSGKPNLGYAPVMNSQSFIQSVREVYDSKLFAANPWTTMSNSPGGIFPHEQIMYDASRGVITDAEKIAKLDSLGAISNSAQAKDLFYRNAIYANHSLAVSGGGRVHRFRASVGYMNNKDATPGNRNDAYNILLRNDLDFGKRVRAYLITQLNNADVSSKRPFAYRPDFVPYQLFKDAAGNNISMAWLNLPEGLRKTYESLSGGISLDYVPLDEVNRGSTKTNSLLAKMIGGITINLLDGLNFEGVYGYQKSNSKTTMLDDAESFQVRKQAVQFTQKAATPGGAPKYFIPVAGGDYTSSHLNSVNWTVRNQLSYNKRWKQDLHQLTLLAGQEAQDQLSQSGSTTLKGYNPQLFSYGAIDYNALATTGVTNPVWANNVGKSLLTTLPYAESETELRFNSYYANGAYTYNRKYTVNGSWRIDHSNLFGKDRSAQNKPIWSAGAAWIISNENFMSGIGMINRLVLRATYGLTGNSPLPGTAASYDIVGPGSNPVYPGGQGLAITTPANRSLVWETTKTYNLGLDFQLLKNRISGSIDLYKKNTENLIGVLPLNVFSGYASIVGNFGNMTNNGIELSLNSINISLPNFSWRSGLILSYNKNKITKLSTTLPITSGSQLLSLPYLEGYSAYALFAYNYAGLNNAGNPQVRLLDGSVHGNISTLPTAADMVYKGSYQPIWNGGFNNSFSYKQFSLYANMVFNFGNVMRRNMNLLYTGRIVRDPNPEFANRWKQAGDEQFTNIPAYIANSVTSSNTRNTNYYTSGDLNVVSAAFVKLRNVTLSYSLPASVTSRIKAHEISFRAGISNMMLWKKNKYGLDPEFQTSNAQAEFAGGYVLPVNQHELTLGAHITF